MTVAVCSGGVLAAVCLSAPGRVCECLRESESEGDKWRRERTPSVKKSNLKSRWMTRGQRVPGHCLPACWLLSAPSSPALLGSEPSR